MNIAIGRASVGARVASAAVVAALPHGGGHVARRMAEVPLLCVLRPGPVHRPAYRPTPRRETSFRTESGAWRVRPIVLLPTRCPRRTDWRQSSWMAWAFQAHILLTEKHLSESRMTVKLPEGLPQVPQLRRMPGRRVVRYQKRPTAFPLSRSRPPMRPSSVELRADEAGFTTRTPAPSYICRRNACGSRSACLRRCAV
jgi:hypothetical protein